MTEGRTPGGPLLAGGICVLDVPMPLHPLQESMDRLPEYLADARSLYRVGEELRAELTKARRAKGNMTGAGAPDARHKSMNRAVVVASVGALEAFAEDLALAALQLVPASRTTDEWFQIDGSRGMVQTPSPGNLAKLFWAYFRYDPRPDWDLLVANGMNEVGATTAWRTGTTQYSATTSPTAVQALAAMVKVRHGFAHQDASNRPQPVPGVVASTGLGKLALHSHHAFNSMSLVVQVAFQTTIGLAGHIPAHAEPFKWRAAMTNAGFERLLADSPVSKVVAAHWVSPPF